MPDALLPLIGFLNQCHLLDDLSGIAQEHFALRGQGHALVGTDENRNPQLLLQLPNGSGEAGLGDKMLLCRLADGTGLGGGDHIFKLCQRHKKPLFK